MRFLLAFLFAYCKLIILNDYGVTLCVYKVAPFFAESEVYYVKW